MPETLNLDSRNRYAHIVTMIQTALVTPLLLLVLSRSGGFPNLGALGRWLVAGVVLLHWFGAGVAVRLERRHPEHASAIASMWIAPNVCIAYLAVLLVAALPH